MSSPFGTSEGPDRPQLSARANPLDVLIHEHTSHEVLCDCLERIADGLPDQIDRDLIASVLPTLEHGLAVHMCDEEHGLFPLLESRVRREDNFQAIRAALSREHAADLLYAEDVVEHLETLKAGESSNPDMLGYMLRGFFDTQRRHLAWENAVLMPLAYERLTREDLRELARIMAGHRKGKATARTRGLMAVFAAGNR